MRVRLKGINRVAKKLADGSSVTYYYAWKGGPRLPGKPGDPEFVAAYNAAVAEKAKQPSGTLQAVLNTYQDSPKFIDLAARTRKDYIRHIKLIESEFGDFPLSALPDRRTRAEFLAWRDKLALKSRRQADYTFATFAAIMAWAADRGLILCNPCERPGKLYRSGRAESIWTEADETAFLKVAPPRIALAYLMAVWTGQRKGDLLRLTWSAYDGTHIRLRQSKTGRRVVIPVSNALKAALDEAAKDKKAVTILTTTKGTSWTIDGFNTEWQKARAKAKVTDLTFHDLRGTAVTRLALADCNEAEIATFTGHSLRDVAAILDAHYLSRDARLAESALSKREAHEAGTKTPN
ncbi:tyrosine-type recombinase/integrase [Pseudooceanicola sp. C21-150M6]|uniref:tyrosine-type recombinase/integrase n=1 Tax=Pseudooceanicola sp. C21-150M6 TaxID=3434355 RepID=UPI003D7FE342